VDEAGQVRVLLSAGDTRSALSILGRAYDQAVDGAEWAVAAFAANWIGHVHEHYLGELIESLRWFDQAAADATRSSTHLPGTVATAAFNAGLINEGKGRTTEAVRRYQRAATAAASAGDQTLDGTCRERLGTLLVELGRTLDGVDQLRAAKRLADRTGRQALARRCQIKIKSATARLEADPLTQFDLLARAGLARCLAAVEPPSPARILDAGCGTGAELDVLAARWPSARIIGVDLPAVAAGVRLRRAQRARIELRPADLTAPLNGLAPVDVALCHSVLHEVDNPAAVLQTLAASIRPGGQLVGACFTTAYYAHVWAQLEEAGADPPRPPFRHRPDLIESALRDAGFTGVELWTEDVTVQVGARQEAPFVERVLRQCLEPAQFAQLMAGAGRPLTLDLAPLHFRGRIPEN
jgi:SAM-dependent methyltransferase